MINTTVVDVCHMATKLTSGSNFGYRHQFFKGTNIVIRSKGTDPLVHQFLDLYLCYRWHGMVYLC